MQRRVVGLLALTQVISWGSLYYAFGVLADDMRQSLALSPTLTFGSYAWALLLSGLCATPVGMLIDRVGGRPVMAVGSVLACFGLVGVATAAGPSSYVLGWTLIGAAMAVTLYEAAFATVNHCVPEHARSAISQLSLFGGLASTAFWPLSAALGAHLGWRQTLLVFAGMQLTLCLPAHLALPRMSVLVRTQIAGGAKLRDALRHQVFWRIALAFAFSTLILSALSVHLIPLFGQWHTKADVVLAAMAIGPMQVLGRFVEMRWGTRFKASAISWFVFAAIPLSLVLAAVWGMYVWGMLVFCALYGLSNGVMTIIRGTLPRELFGQRNYGAIAGALAAPALFAKASGPLMLSSVAINSQPQLAFLGLALLGLVALLLFPRAIQEETP